MTLEAVVTFKCPYFAFVREKFVFD